MELLTAWALTSRQKSREGAGGVVSRGETLGPARHSYLVLDRTYLLCVGYAKKGGLRRPRDSMAGGASERDTGGRDGWSRCMRYM